MDVIVIFGPPAVGKMTVGAALSRLTGYPLFHNHATIEAVRTVFAYHHPAFWPLVTEFRRRVFEEAVAHGTPGLIYTFAWSLNDPADKAYIDSLTGIAERAGGTTRYAELYAPYAERVRRNEHEARLAAKPSKRDLPASRAFLQQVEGQAVMNTDGEFYCPDRHVRIDNAELTPEQAARRIVEAFGLACVA